MERKRKRSSANYAQARESLGLEPNATHQEIVSAAIQANSTTAPGSNPIMQSPTKEEVKKERDDLNEELRNYKSNYDELKDKIGGLVGNLREARDQLECERKENTNNIKKMASLQDTVDNLNSVVGPLRERSDFRRRQLISYWKT